MPCLMCDGKTTVPKGSGGGGRKEGGGEEMFALAEIHVRLTILKIRCIIFFLSKRQLKLNN